MTRVSINFRATSAIVESLRGVARSEDVSASTVVRWAIQEWAERGGVDLGEGMECGRWQTATAVTTRVNVPMPLTWRTAIRASAGSSARMPGLMANIVADYLRGLEGGAVAARYGVAA